MQHILQQFNHFDYSKSNIIQNVVKHPLNYHNFHQNKCTYNYKFDWIPKFPYFHNCIGNHELYNFSRKQLLDYFYSNKKRPEEFYYAFSPFKNYLFIILDAFVVSMMGYSYYNKPAKNKSNSQAYSSHMNLKMHQVNLNDHPNKIIADKILADTHKHPLQSGFNSPPNQIGDVQRFAAYNGGFGEEQLKWLETQLKAAQVLKDNVIIFSHVPIHCFKSDVTENIRGDEKILAWDYEQAMKIIGKYTCAKMFFAGHAHSGWVGKDANGVWHKTLDGAVEANESWNCFATAFFYEDKVTFKGYGMDTQSFDYRPF